MHNTTHYVDRGIIKWAPFDALVGYQSMLKELKHRLGKKDRPMLSEDQLIELNQKLHLAWEYHQEVEVSYYASGYIKQTFGYIKKLDWISKTIVLDTLERIAAEDVIELYISSKG